MMCIIYHHLCRKGGKEGVCVHARACVCTCLDVCAFICIGKKYLINKRLREGLQDG